MANVSVILVFHIGRCGEDDVLAIKFKSVPAIATSKASDNDEYGISGRSFPPGVGVYGHANQPTPLETDRPLDPLHNAGDYQCGSRRSLRRGLPTGDA